MKKISKIILFLIFIFGYERIFARDTSDSVVSVHLRQNIQNECHLDLVFKNNSEDTVYLLSRFKHFYSEWSTVSGIQINGYMNHKPVGLSWGELPPKYFTFSNGHTKIPPQSAVFFKFDIMSAYCHEHEENYEFGVDFDVNYLYSIVRENGNIVKEISITTNYVKFEKRKQIMD